MKQLNKFKALTAICTIALASASFVQADEAWQREAGVGKYTPETQDWAAIESAAREEGTVTIYSVSSRILPQTYNLKNYGAKIMPGFTPLTFYLILNLLFCLMKHFLLI